MDDRLNPYAAPEYQGGPELQSSAAPGEVQGEVMMALLQTRRWVMVIGVLCVLFAGLMCLGALAMLAMAGMRPSSEMPLSPAALSGFYLAVAGVYVPPALFLLRYAGAIRDLQRNRTQEALARALSHQKSFWKYAAILSLVVVGLYLLLIVGAVFVGFMAGFAQPI